ncbi:unnamed protein product [Linum tenue]|uniref:Uncharacterized protein n=1 Tax=Linum tenue TaxID=586396 RepID=A0AAV0L083_9ROSI|nr:unnamed protein product [Linum tenue]
MELWTCMSRHLCVEEKERPSESCPCEPICRRGLGNSYVVTCCSVFISRRCSSVRKGLGVLQGPRESPMSQIRDLHTPGFRNLACYCYFISRYVLDLSLRVDTQQATLKKLRRQFGTSGLESRTQGFVSYLWN